MIQRSDSAVAVWKRLRHTPCAKTSLLQGLQIGALAGVAVYVPSRRIMRSCNVAVGVSILASAVSWYG